MPRQLLLLALILGLLSAIGRPNALGQEATPAVDEGAATELILRISDADLTSNDLGVIGFVRAVYGAGAEQNLAATEGPALLFIESGSLSVVPGDGAVPLVVSDGGSGVADSPAALTAGEEASLEAGQALILPPGSAATIRNTGDTPAVTLDLLPSGDVETQPAEGVNQRLIARHETAAPSSPFAIELGRATIQPGKQHPNPANALDFLVSTVDPAQLFVLTRNNFNRGASPMEIYVLTITPEEAGVTTPTA